MSTSHTSPGGGAFEKTHWSVVMKAADLNAPGATAAFAGLYQTYSYPLYAFIRQRGHSHHNAEDLAHGFFAHLLEKNSLKNVTVEGGKFRSYLLKMLKCFLANERDHDCAQKRGGGKIPLSIDDKADDTRYACEPADLSTPESLYERRWAMTLLDQVMNRLRAERTAAGKGDLFEALREHLTGAEKSVRYEELGARLRMSEGAVKKAVHDLRKRYGKLLRAEIATTVSSPEEVEEEIQHLIDVASR